MRDGFASVCEAFSTLAKLQPSDRILYVDPQETYTGKLSESGSAGHGGEVR